MSEGAGTLVHVVDRLSSDTGWSARPPDPGQRSFGHWPLDLLKVDGAIPLFGSMSGATLQVPGYGWCLLCLTCRQAGVSQGPLPRVPSPAPVRIIARRSQRRPRTRVGLDGPRHLGRRRLASLGVSAARRAPRVSVWTRSTWRAFHRGDLRLGWWRVGWCSWPRTVRRVRPSPRCRRSSASWPP